MTRRPVVAIAAFGGAAAAYVLMVRPWHLRWGSTDPETDGPMPGDGLIDSPDLTATRAITIGAPPDQVWPWIAQLGQGRGGFYSYDFLENLAGCDIHSVDRIVPQWQDVSVGDEIRLAPEVRMAVAVVEPGRSLVVRGGVPMGNIPPPYDFTWAFDVRGEVDGTTRLVVRDRYAYTRPWARLLVEPVEVVSFLMTHRMLRGVRDRVERGRSEPAISALPSRS